MRTLVYIALFTASGLGLANLGAATTAQAQAEAPETEADSADAAQPEPEKLCLAVRQIRDHRVPEPGQLEFRVKAGSYVKVHFQQRCDALTRRSLISYRSVGSNLCRNDRVDILQSLGSSAMLDDQCFVAGFSAVEN